jgi:hypothetical protein
MGRGKEDIRICRRIGGEEGGGKEKQRRSSVYLVH